MIFIFIIFAILGVIFLFLSHWAVYRFIAYFFAIENAVALKILAAILIFLGLSFLFSSLLTHWLNNFFTRFFYFTSGVWLGALINLLMVIAVSWIIISLWGTDSRTAITTIGALTLILTALYSGYGVWNAYNLRVKYVDVSIKNLPSTWQGKKAVHISDLHLGNVFGREFMQEIVDKINIIKPDIIFITGDLFDGMITDFNNFLIPWEQITAPLGTYFVSGNHESYIGWDKARPELIKAGIKVLDDDLAMIDGLQVIGLSYPPAGQRKDLKNAIEAIKGFDNNSPSILLYHEPAQINKVRSTGISLQLSGHTHQGQIFPFGLITKMIYRNYDYGLKSVGDYSIYTTSGAGAWGPTMRIGSASEIVVLRMQ